jgi:aminoglycoside phosphotransferase (APT) family kinase protein
LDNLFKTGDPMISKTKFSIDEATIKTLFHAAGIDGVTHVSPLGTGEYNSVFEVLTKEQEYVIKIAPAAGAPILTYEKDMMASELFWYEQLREHTDIRIPIIYDKDFSRALIPTEYFIMEKVRGKQMNEMDFTEAERTEADDTLAHMAAQIHRIKNERFGYIQNGLHDTWYSAICSMVENLILDSKKKNKRSPNGEKLLQFIHENKALLESVESRMVNFDLWAPNILCQRKDNGKIEYVWVDPERTFWGDPIADFVALDFVHGLSDKKKTLEAYNAVAEHPVFATMEEQTRFAIAQGYLAFIMEVEKYYRYSLFHFGWWRNRMVSSFLYKKAWEVLEKTNH